MLEQEQPLCTSQDHSNRAPEAGQQASVMEKCGGDAPSSAAPAAAAGSAAAAHDGAGWVGSAGLRIRRVPLSTPVVVRREVVVPGTESGGAAGLG